MLAFLFLSSLTLKHQYHRQFYVLFSFLYDRLVEQDYRYATDLHHLLEQGQHNLIPMPFLCFFFQSASFNISNKELYSSECQTQANYLTFKYEISIQNPQSCKSRILLDVKEQRRIKRRVIWQKKGGKQLQSIMILKGRFQILKGYQNNHVTIGFGSYGQVKLARDLQTTEIVAVKVINKIAKNEVMMHYGLAHPKIIRLLDVHIDTERQITYMMLQYAEGGTLFDKIKMGAISKKEIKQYFRDICEALAYLHSQNIMHRDIKPENVLLTKNNEAKLCDFGFAAILGERKTLCGTYEYMSPEMIQNRPYDYKIDIWALGILLFQLIAGHAPFRGDKPQEVLEQMKTKIYFCQRFQPEDVNLVKTILRVTPHKRPKIQEILDQPFFKGQDKTQQLTAHSTTNTEDTKAKNASFQYLNESCNPKKMAELQKLLEKQQPKELQKQTYPPFYVPKNVHKFGVGVPIPNYMEQKQVKSYSPLHYNKPINTTLPLNNPQPGYYKPMPQMNPPIGSNKSFNNPQMKPPTQGFNQVQTPNSIPVNYVNPNKTVNGFGRFS